MMVNDTWLTESLGYREMRDPREERFRGQGGVEADTIRLSEGGPRNRHLPPCTALFYGKQHIQPQLASARQPERNAAQSTGIVCGRDARGGEEAHYRREVRGRVGRGEDLYGGRRRTASVDSITCLSLSLSLRFHASLYGPGRRGWRLEEGLV